MRLSIPATVIAALFALPVGAIASEAVWRVAGTVDRADGAGLPGGINPGDPFSFLLHFDTAAPVTNPGTCGDGGVGTVCRHNGDPGMYFSDIRIGSFHAPSFSDADGGQSAIVRNNAPDPGFGDTIDGYTFGVRRFSDSSENTSLQVLWRGPEDLDVVSDGRSLPALPPAGLMSLRTRVFQVCDSQVDFDCRYIDLSGTIGSVSAVPEPETLALMVAGLVVIGFAARRPKH